MDGCHDFPLRHGLAAADYPAVGLVLTNHLVLFLQGGVTECVHWPADGLIILLRAQGKPLFRQHAHHILRNGGSGGKPRGLDSRHVDEAGQRRVNDEVPRISCGAQPRKGSNGLAQRDILHILPGLGDDLVKALLGGGLVLLVLPVHRSGPQKQVSVHRWGNQDALSHFRGRTEDSVGHETTALPVQQQVFSPAGMDSDGIVSRQPGDFVRVDSRSVHHISGADHPLLCGLHRVETVVFFPHLPPNPVEILPAAGKDYIAIFLFFNMGHFKIQQQRRTVIHGISYCGDSQFIRTDDSSGGRIKGACHLIGKSRLQPPGLLSVYDPQLLNAILHAPGIEPFYGFPVLIPETDNHRAVFAVRYS